MPWIIWSGFAWVFGIWFLFYLKMAKRWGVSFIYHCRWFFDALLTISAFRTIVFGLSCFESV